MPKLLSIHCGIFLSHFPNVLVFFFFYQNPALFLVKFSRQKNLKLHTMQIFNKKNIRKAFSRSRTKIKQIYLSFSNMTRLKRLLVVSALKLQCNTWTDHWCASLCTATNKKLVNFLFWTATKTYYIGIKMLGFSKEISILNLNNSTLLHSFVIFSVAETIWSVIGRFLASKTASKSWKININSHSWPYGHSGLSNL